MKCQECKKYSMKDKCCNKITLKAMPLNYSNNQTIANARRKLKNDRNNS